MGDMVPSRRVCLISFTMVRLVSFGTSRSVLGVEVNKLVGNRIIPKRIHVRVEHVSHSKCRQEFLDRAKKNDAVRAAAKAKGEKYDVKRKQPGPRPAQFVKKPKVTTLTPLKFVGLYQ